MRRASHETVDFVSALESAQRISTVSDETVWIEIDLQPVCTGFIKSIIPSHQLIAIPSIRRGVDNWTTMSESMATLHQAGVTLNWNDFHLPFEGRLRLLDLPTYAWSEKNHWLQYNGDWCLTKGNTFYNANKDENLQPDWLLQRAARYRPQQCSKLRRSVSTAPPESLCCGQI